MGSSGSIEQLPTIIGWRAADCYLCRARRGTAGGCGGARQHPGLKVFRTTRGEFGVAFGFGNGDIGQFASGVVREQHQVSVGVGTAAGATDRQAVTADLLVEDHDAEIAGQGDAGVRCRVHDRACSGDGDPDELSSGGVR